VILLLIERSYIFMKHCCEEMVGHLDRGEIGLVYFKKFRIYFISYLDIDNLVEKIQYCPWCGTRLPEDLEDQWNEEIKLLGFDPGDSNIPKDYKSDQWWRKKKPLKC